MGHRTLSWPVRATLVAVTAAAITGIGGAVATADDTTDPAFTVTTYEVFRETVKPWDSIKIPSRSCPVGYLHNENYSPGRIIPAGVEVVEPGVVGVTITRSTDDVAYGGDRQIKPITGSVASDSASGATNWDPLPRH